MDTVESADFVIVGAGTAGLVLANRLSENPDVTVLLIESGGADSDEKTKDIDNWPMLLGPEYSWQYKSIPQPFANDREFELPQGRILGGSSSINGAYYFPPSRATIDAWAKLGNLEWSYDALLPYIKKSQTYHAPDAEICAAHGLQRASAASNASGGLVQVCAPDLKHQNPLLQAWNRLIKESGHEVTSELVIENPVGGACFTASVDPHTGKRSGSGSEHGRLALERPNVKLLTKTMVEKISFERGHPHLIATGVEVRRDGQATSFIKADKEVILCAGSLGSPKLLELSGVGDAQLLGNLGIDVLVNNSSVGENLQDHDSIVLPIQMQEGVEAGLGARGIFFIPIRQCHGFEDQTHRKEFFDRLRPSSQKDQAHFDIVRKTLDEQGQAAANLHISPFPGTSMMVAVAVRSAPFSKGSSHITSKDPSQMPQIDLGTFSQPADLEVAAQLLLAIVELLDNPLLTPFLKPLQGEFAVRDIESAKTCYRKNVGMTYHPSGTAVMMPREAGGVVDQQLFVYGTQNLRVADISIFPVLTHANPMPAVYAMAERAADMIKAHHG